MFYFPQYGDTRYKRKLVLFPINIDGIRHAWETIYVRQYYDGFCWRNESLISKETYLKWRYRK